jgi:hypothetical protein
MPACVDCLLLIVRVLANIGSCCFLRQTPRSAVWLHFGYKKAGKIYSMSS